MAIPIKRRFALWQALIPAKVEGGYNPEWDCYRNPSYWRIPEVIEKKYLPMLEHGRGQGFKGLCENGHLEFIQIPWPVFPRTPEVMLLRNILENPRIYGVEDIVGRWDVDLWTVLGVARMKKSEDLTIQDYGKPTTVNMHHVMKHLIHGFLFPGTIMDVDKQMLEGARINLGYVDMRYDSLTESALPGRPLVTYASLGIPLNSACSECGGKLYPTVVAQAHLWKSESLVDDITRIVLEKFGMRDYQDVKKEVINEKYDEIKQTIADVVRHGGETGRYDLGKLVKVEA